VRYIGFKERESIISRRGRVRFDKSFERNSFCSMSCNEHLARVIPKCKT